MTRDFDREEKQLERNERRYARLGDNPHCLICREDDIRCLEPHHIAGRANSNVTVIVCRNCHRKLSDSQYDWPEGLLQGGNGSPQDWLRAYLLGEADLAEEFGSAQAKRLRAQAETLKGG